MAGLDAALHDAGALSGRTAILCRPEQMCEAAIALSCCPATASVVLIVATRPPQTEEAYSKRYETFIDCFRRRRELMGRLTLQVADSAEEFASLQRALQDSAPEDQALARDLDPYRAWFTRHLRISELLDKNRPQRVLCLTELASTELRPLGTGGAMRARGERAELLSDASLSLWRSMPDCDQPGCDASTPCLRCMEDLAGTAWRFFHGDAAMPECRVSCRQNDLLGMFPALLRALRGGGPLKILPAAPDSRMLVSYEPEPPAGDADNPTPEAVLVEVENDASLLLAVQYAQRQHARLVCIAAPDPAGIQEALLGAEHFQQARAAAADKGRAAVSVASDVLQRARAWFDGVRYPPLVEIEACVRRAIPHQAVELVGSAPLTAITRGTPYHFIRHGLVDWRKKPIGHVMGDPYLVLLHELHGPPKPDTPSFDVLFDPGAFPEETAVIAAALAGRSSPLITLTGDASNADTLRDLCRVLPVELIYLNSHGTAGGVELAHGLVPRLRIGQSMFLNPDMYTIVINNSCLSWQGMGREFIRCGAGSYVGTLWSVDAHEAAAYANRIVSRLSRGISLASAVASERGPGLTGPAYIVVGTLHQYLATPTQEKPGATSRNLALADQLFIAAYDFAKRDDFRDNSWSQTLVQQFSDQADHLIASVLNTNLPGDGHSLASALLSKAQLLLRLGATHHLHEVQGLLSRVATLADLADEPGGDPSMREQLRIQLLRLQARLAIALGKPAAAQSIYAKLDNMPDDIAAYGGVYAEMSDFFKRSGELDKALRYAERAMLAASHQADPVERMRDTALSLGRMVQLRLRFRQFDVARGDAERGLALATQLDNEFEQFEYTADLARICISQRNWDEALRHVDACTSISLRSINSLQYVNTLGMRAIIETARRNWRAAAKAAYDGLNRSSQLGAPEMTADFHMDIARILVAIKDESAALKHAEVALHLYEQTGSQRSAKQVAAMIHMLKPL